MKLKLDRTGPTELIATRLFTSSVDLVYRAHTEADLVAQWMTGPEDWEMTECVWDAQVGGSFRVTWAHESEGAFTQTGEFIALEKNKRIEHVERFPGISDCDNHIVTEFIPQDGGTLLRLVMSMDDEEALTKMIESGMAVGMEDSYARIDDKVAPALAA